MAVLRPGHDPFRRADRLRHDFWSYTPQDSLSLAKFDAEDDFDVRFAAARQNPNQIDNHKNLPSDFFAE